MTVHIRAHRRSRRIVVSSTAVLLAATSFTPAAVVSWTGLAGNGQWGTAGNWSSSPALPGPTDDVVNTLNQTITHLAGTDTINTFLGTGTLSLQSGVLAANVPGVGTIQVNNTFSLNGGTLRGFVILPGNGGQGVTALSISNNFFDNVTSNAAVSALTLRFMNGFTLNNTLTVGANGILGFQESQSLQGSGTIVFDASASNRLSIDGAAPATLTIGSGMVIRGINASIGPAIFNANASRIVNNGLISSDGGGSFQLTPGSGAIDAIINNGVLDVRNGSNIRLDRHLTQLGTGHIDVSGVFSAFNQAGSRITGGTVNVTLGGGLVANNNANNFLDNVTVNGTLNLSAGGQERLANGLTLNGTINLNSNGILGIQESQTLSGIGTVLFGASPSNRLSIDGAAATTFTIGSNIILRGQNATIGPAVYQATTSKIVNNGTISADTAAGTFTLQPNNGNPDAILNNNLIEARNGGAIQLSSNLTNTGSGHVDVLGGSTLTQSGVRITAGTINVSPGGNFITTNSGSNFLSAVTVNGDVNMSATSQERILNGLTLNGTATINGNSVIGFQETQSLGGTGTLNFGSAASNRLSIDGAVPSTLTLGAGIVIRGQNASIGPSIYQATTTKIVNNGVISADTASGTFTLQPSSGAADAIVNNNLVEARNGGAILLNSNLTNAGAGRIDMLTGSTLTQSAVRITGGTLNVASGANFVPTNSGNNFLDGVTINGNINMAATAVERVIGAGLVLNGTATVNTNSILSFHESQTLAGTATILFGSSPTNRLSIDGSAPATLTLGSNVIVRGQNGNIGASALAGTTTKLVNNGTISADTAAGTLALQTSSDAVDSITNNNLIEARNGGALLLSSNLTNGLSGHVDVLGASTLVQASVRITGGTLNVASGGNFVPTNNANNFLDGVTVNGNINMSAVAVERVTGAGLVLNGVATLNADSILSFQESQTLNGTATILFGSTTSNRLSIDGSAPTTLTLGSNVIVRGQNGSIGASALVGTTTKLVNNGTISADVAPGALTLQTSSGAADSIANNNLIEARNGAAIQLNSNLTNSGTGHVDVAAGSTFAQNGVKITGGVLNVAPGGDFKPSNNGNNFLDSVTVNGDINMTAASQLRILNGLTLNGTANLSAASIIGFQSTQTLGGTGTLAFSAAPTNRLSIDGAGSATLTLGPAITLRGAASVGPAVYQSVTSKLINNGTISADLGGGSIHLQTSSPAADSILNNGLFEARNGGQLRIGANTTVGPSGSLLVNDGTSTIHVQAALAGGRPVVNHGSFLLSGSLAGGAVGVISGSGTTSLSAAGTLSATHIRQSELSINVGTLAISPGGGTLGTSVLGSLSIVTAGTSALDLSNHDMILDYTGATPIGTVRTLLQNGYALGTWTGRGITSSAARVSPSPKTSLGYRESVGEVFSGQSADTSAVLIKYTFAGDTNLDGQVDITDLGNLATNWQTAGLWGTGDFDYSGFIDITDLGILATNWQAGVGNPLGPSLDQAMASVGLPLAGVPEPGGVSIWGIACAILLRRRRGVR